MPSMSLGIESVKKWVDYWRKFKGKRVRAWFVGRSVSSIGVGHQHSCWALEVIDREQRERQKHDKNTQSCPRATMRVLEACSCVEGEISDIVDSPFGIILTNIKYWNVLQPEKKRESDLVHEDMNPEISQMFIPMSEIARIDFLNEN